MMLLQDLETDVTDLARALPGSEDIAEAMVGLIQQWKARAVVAMAPQPAAMPGAPGMM
jgi:hypothetical protein